LKDYYAVLGLKKGASAQEIKRAYKRMVKKWHPDLNADDPQCQEKMKEINEAFATLNGSGKRRAYDKKRESWEENLRQRMFYDSAKGGHPFFSFSLKMEELSRKKSKK
jgi:DnaJ-class molecular chaperone